MSNIIIIILSAQAQRRTMQQCRRGVTCRSHNDDQNDADHHYHYLDHHHHYQDRNIHDADADDDCDDDQPHSHH